MARPPAIAPEDEALGMLSTIFEGINGWLDVRLIQPDDGGTRRIACADIAAALIEAEKAEADPFPWNVYIGIATRATRSTAKGAGGKEHLRATRALWVDFDDLASVDGSLALSV